ncbi:MAG: hypothetical protein ACR2G6_17645 [Gemmatimonadaceae bacterium]
MHRRLPFKVAALARKETQERDLVVTVRIDLELAAVMPVRYKRLIQLRHLEGAGHVLGIAGANVL